MPVSPSAGSASRSATMCTTTVYHLASHASRRGDEIHCVPMRRALPRTVVLIGFTSFFTDISSEMIVSLLPLLMLGPMGASPIAIGLVDGVADAVSSVLKLIAGRWSDRTGTRKPFLLAGYGLSFLVRPLVTFAM